jgi:hypothetical protein
MSDMRAITSLLPSSDAKVTAVTLTNQSVYYCTSTPDSYRLHCLPIDDASSGYSHPLPRRESIEWMVCKGSTLLLASENNLFVYSTSDTSKPSESTAFPDRITAIAVEDEIEMTSPLLVVIGFGNGSILQYLVGKYSWFNKSLHTMHGG